jgi:hypothetical protein
MNRPVCIKLGLCGSKIFLIPPPFFNVFVPTKETCTNLDLRNYECFPGNKTLKYEKFALKCEKGFDVTFKPLF